MRPVPAETTIRARLDAATARLAAAGVETARADAEWLLANLLGVGRTALALALTEPLDDRLRARYEAAVRRRAGREPLQWILGWEEFRGLRLALSPAVLVPRPETELLVEHALTMLPPAQAQGRRPLVVDVGTGSGAIACAVASERSDVDVVATDCAPEALAIATDNARRLGLGERVRLVAADLLQPLASAVVDLVVANPPYLPSRLLSGLQPEVRDHEPRGALDGGQDGLLFLRRLVAEARRALRPGGALVVETGGGDQPAAIAELAQTVGFTDIRPGADLNGIVRYVTARTLSSAGSAGATVLAGSARGAPSPSGSTCPRA